MLVADVQRPPMPPAATCRASCNAQVLLPTPCAPPSRNSSPTRSPPCRYESSGLNPVGMPRSPFARPARTSPSSCSSTPRRLTIRCPCTLDCPGVATPTPFRPPTQPPGSLGTPRRLRIRRTAHPQRPSSARCDPHHRTVDSPPPRACSSAGERCLHTAEATGSKPVTPTSTNASQSPPFGPLARRFARRVALRVVASGQRGLIRAAGKPTRLLCAVKGWSRRWWLAPGGQHGRADLHG